MGYCEQYQEENEQIKERWKLSFDRIREIADENAVPEPFCDYFRKEASFLLLIEKLWTQLDNGTYKNLTLEQLEQWNQSLYQDILTENYQQSYGNPDYAAARLGAEFGGLFSFLYSELRGCIAYAFENRLYYITIYQELLLECYQLFTAETLPGASQIKDTLYWFMSDYSDVLVRDRILSQINPQKSFAVPLIMESDLSDLRYLYQYGEFVSENERKTAEYLNSLSAEKIQVMADTYTEGYRIGFELSNKDLAKKKTVDIRYRIGFERIVRQAVYNFEKLGLQPVIYRYAASSINKRQQHRIGFTGGLVNKQYDYDHRADQCYYMDKAFIERKIAVIKDTFEKHKEIAAGMAGPAVIETFGEHPFTPEKKEYAGTLDDKQQKLSVYYDNTVAGITNEYIKGEERSFTIIAFPLPEISSDFKEIFDEVVKVNTLDYKLYQRIQQKLIDALDQGEYVHVKGKGSNKTDLTVCLQSVNDPDQETKFENCVADVNIPVGEVFTSPQLKGTNGTLYVSKVYLNELQYQGLELTFEDGRITEYNCTNFDTEAENKKFLRENLLYNHESLPMGEFAIGTNTTAYVMAEKYQIADKLPILIAEKMGPHFAVGDTCYSWSEDIKVYNPDGKEIIARENEQSVLRREDPAKAYYNCHTDITIPYDELEEITVITEENNRIVLIADGHFVLPGTEELNKPLRG